MGLSLRVRTVSRASGAESEELQSMGNAGESVALRQQLFEFHREALFDLHNQGTLFANEVVVVSFLPFGNEFEPCGSIPKIVAPHQSHALQGVQIPINRGQVAGFGSQRLVDFPVGEGVLMSAQDLQNGLTWTGDLAGMLPKRGGQLAHRRRNEAVQVGRTGSAHRDGTSSAGGRRRRDESPSEIRNRATQVRTIVGPHGRSNW